MHHDYFSAKQLRRQWKALREAEISPFYLDIGSLDSFTTAPYLTIKDPKGILDKIRGCLRVISKEDTLSQYQPHITLGFYRDAFDTVEVSKCLARFEYAPTKPIPVTELSFCVYETKEIQGCFKAVKCVELGMNRQKSAGCMQ